MTFLDRSDRTTLAAARLFAGQEDGTVIGEDAGMLMVASARPYLRSLFYSSARRYDRTVPAAKSMEAVRSFGAEHSQPLNLWASVDGDADLIAAAEAIGMTRGIELDDMGTTTAPAIPAPGPEVELAEVRDPEEADAFAEVHRALRIEAKQDPDTVLHFGSPAVLLDPHVHAFVAYLEREPAAAALALRHEDSAGLFWVATKTSARKRGLGALVSAAAVDGAFQAGAKSATLTATPLGAPVYRRLGFERFSGRARYSF
ncbi:GNAT family N-acetyltransferase [Catenulispora sp. NF23]|uniref:GNAT family N-acetyltransferase n=1 Tax=Catenulispora pinistramenti TaxID=2705254 RepID=A0ABS5L1I3_9ACTN|nr:GNAT family N-acetyltransferase [Catenulispora pinistramenti]MBS2534900.1 GNAT family N-acetyltransferase [Catenulispora pinistramenti]MBS2552187.1 GNAT family N-acetyltransferase [Catenulispora pinistramenti]